MGQRNANTVEGEEGVKLLGYSQCVHGRAGVEKRIGGVAADTVSKQQEVEFGYREQKRTKDCHVLMRPN